ncbi:MAG: GNAT family N-acetyltransferase [Dehalococcoidia bacterium]|nr:GNAT family N-acetyltransferase [Dehalococcoidia bacterium]
MSELAGGVVLRAKRRSDLGDDYAWRIDPELARLDSRPVSRVTFEEFEQEFLAALEFPPPGVLSLSIDVGGEHVGNLVAYDIISGESCEIGVVIGRERQRHRGIGREAVTAFLQHAWHRLGLRRVYLHTLEDNAPARRSFEACGFRASARVQRQAWMIRYEARREWWLMEDERTPYPKRKQVAREDNDSSDGNEPVTC